MDGKTTPSLDAHHHFWRYAPAQYGWIGDDMRAIRRDFLPPDLALELQATGIDGVAKPRIRDAALEPWAQEIRRLAERRASGLSEGDRAEIFGGTACRAYGLAGGP